jgi:hypothetical protein
MNRKINFIAKAGALTLLIVVATARPTYAEDKQVDAWQAGRSEHGKYTGPLVDDMQLVSPQPLVALGGMTAVSVQVLHKGTQEVERNVLFRDGGSAVISERYGFPIAIFGEQINPDDFTGFWRLTISKVTFDQSGVATVDARLDTREARRQATGQNLSVSIDAGKGAAVIHGANGKDYLLNVRHVAPVI